MNSTQLILGNGSEEYVAQWLKSKKYWAYILPKKVGGQPFDIIACKENIVWMVDVKHIEDKASFPFSRIEPNQRTSMRYARELANITNLGFVIKTNRDNLSLYFLSFDNLLELEKNGAKSVKIEALPKWEI